MGQSLHISKEEENKLGEEGVRFENVENFKNCGTFHSKEKQYIFFIFISSLLMNLDKLQFKQSKRFKV